jgi:putative copper export protein
MLTVLHDTSWGRGWIVGAVGIAVAAVGLLMARSAPAEWVVTGIGAAAIAVSEGLTGHPAAAANVPLAAVVDVTHLIGAGGWIGGLAAVALCGLAATRRFESAGGTTASHQLVRSFHRSAVVCVSIVLLTALAGAWLRLGSLSDLWTTGYGFVLLVKLLLVVVLLAFGWFHWKTAVIPEWTDDTRFRFRRSVALELVVGACIIAATAVLITTALPRS